MPQLSADFSSAFRRDLKRKARRRRWDLSELEKVIDLVLENTPETQDYCATVITCLPLAEAGKGATSAMWQTRAIDSSFGYLATKLLSLNEPALMTSCFDRRSFLA